MNIIEYHTIHHSKHICKKPVHLDKVNTGSYLSLKKINEVKKPTYDNSTPPTSYSKATIPQRQRLLNHLIEHQSITTLEARHKLDIMHPAGLKKELRDKEGFNIVTRWRTDKTPEGKEHRVAEYVLLPGKHFENTYHTK